MQAIKKPLTQRAPCNKNGGKPSLALFISTRPNHCAWRALHVRAASTLGSQIAARQCGAHILIKERKLHHSSFHAGELSCDNFRILYSQKRANLSLLQ
jgi:hypothetical protein